MMKYAVLTFILISNLALASNKSSINIEDTKIKSVDRKTDFYGHLLSSTSNTAPEGTVIAGTHLVTYSPTDDVMIGTASFLWLFYNSPNLFVKIGHDLSEKSRVAFQFDYFKSTETGILGDEGYYQMEGAMAWGIYSYKVTDSFTTHLNVNYMYFLDETEPHSLRRELYNEQPYQWSVSSLQEIKIDNNWGFGFEGGLLGINYEIPFGHLAFTGRYAGSNYLLQFGVSASVALETLSSSDIDPVYLDDAGPDTSEVVTHPEIQLQYFF